MSIEQIMLYGRWVKLSSCKEYLRKSQVFFMQVHTLAAGGRNFVRVVEHFQPVCGCEQETFVSRDKTQHLGKA